MGFLFVIIMPWRTVAEAVTAIALFPFLLLFPPLRSRNGTIVFAVVVVIVTASHHHQHWGIITSTVLMMPCRCCHHCDDPPSQSSSQRAEVAMKKAIFHLVEKHIAP